MLPIYNEYISFLKTKNIKDDWLREGYFWQNNQIIKGYVFDKNNELKVIKLLRVNVDENLNVNHSYYKNTDFNQKWLNWEEVYKYYEKEIKSLEKDSLDLILKNKLGKDIQNVILTIGGKDSNLIDYLVHKHIKNPRIIFNNTSLDVKETYKYIKSRNDIEIISPKEGFYQWRERLNFVPTRFARACCELFKEGQMTKYLPKEDTFIFFMGMRNQESSTRSEYGDCWKNKKWGNRNWNAILPIRKWDELFVWLYTIHNKIDINVKYKMGYNRVGCGIACPYYSKTTWVLDKYWYEAQFDRWRKILEKDFIKNNKALIMNCTLEEYLYNWNGGPVREEPTKEVIKEFASMNNLDYCIAEKYFCHRCKECNKRIKAKEVIAMNLKLHGRDTNKIYCKKHLMSMYKLTEKQWNSQVTSFKGQGCELF